MDHVRKTDREYGELSLGVRPANLIGGAQTSMKSWRIEPGAILPTHRHSNEQIEFLISGRLNAVLEDGEVPREPGDSSVFSGDEFHGAENCGDEPAVGTGVLDPPRDAPNWGDDRAASEPQQTNPIELNK